MILAKNFANPNPKSDNQLYEYEDCVALLEQLCFQNHDHGISSLEHPSKLLPKDLIFVKKDNQSRHDFFSSVGIAMTQSARLPNLNKFHLHTSYDSSFQPLVNEWLCYARDRNVQDVDLSLWHDVDHVEESDQIVLDDSLFVNSSLTNLKLSCDFVNPTTGLFGWSNLKSLSLSNKSDLDNNSLDIILSETPHLETFELNDCYGFDLIDISSKSVKNFVISGRKRLLDDAHVHLHAPYILSLTVDGALTSCSLYLLKLKSLVEAKFCYHVYDYGYIPFFNEYEEQDTLELHIVSLARPRKHPLELKLGMRCLEVLSILKADGFVLPQNIKVVDDEKFN